MFPKKVKLSNCWFSINGKADGMDLRLLCLPVTLRAAIVRELKYQNNEI